MVEIKGLFPTALYVAELKNIMPSEIKKIMTIYEDKDKWKTNINNNFTSKEVYVFDNLLGNKSFLVNEIQHHINNYCEKILGEKPALKPTQSWLNFNPPGTSHHKHCHGNSIVSGVLYFKTTPKSGALVLHKREFFTIKNSTINNTTFNNDIYRVFPKEHTLILFPSSLEHSVDNNESDETRISLAFNTFYRDTIIGDEFNLTGLKV